MLTTILDPNQTKTLKLEKVVNKYLEYFPSGTNYLASSRNVFHVNNRFPLLFLWFGKMFFSINSFAELCRAVQSCVVNTLPIFSPKIKSIPFFFPFSLSSDPHFLKFFLVFFCVKQSLLARSVLFCMYVCLQEIFIISRNKMLKMLN